VDNFKCPICGTNEDKPVVLVGISGTEEGCNIKARQYHLECIELRESPEVINVSNSRIGDIFMVFNWKGDNDARD
jgi:hypothetical protein